MAQPASNPRGRPVSDYASFRKIADRLRARLIANEWPPGTPMPSLRALAKEYSVSLDIMRAAMKVMRQEDRVNITGFRRLTAVPLMASKAPMEHALGLMIVMTSPLRIFAKGSDHNLVLMGMLQGAGELDVPITITHGYTLRSTPPTGMLHLPIRGMLLYGPLEPAGYPLFEKLPFPVVMVDRPAGRRRLLSVAVDNVGAMRDAIRRLANQGHQRIAFVRRISLAERDVDPDSQERQNGFKKAIREQRLPWSSMHVFSLFSSDTEHCRALQSLANPANGFTAAICSDPGAAQLLIAAATRQGRKVPRDLSILSFQGKSSTIQISGPAIDFFELGRRAAVLAGKATATPPACERVATVWNEFGSTSPAKST